ncbi:hypothetical protein BMA10399_I0416 [Burkholderia mallei ATCC 10399]|nr:hypothetical protein BMA10399_I0416 [Burkholderia mallei ATCC 10399]
MREGARCSLPCRPGPRGAAARRRIEAAHRCDQSKRLIEVADRSD